MAFYSENLFPRLTEAFLNNSRLNIERRTALSSTHGRVLEVGFGSGLNLPFYPKGIESLVALDPSEQSLSLAEQRIKGVSFPVEFVQDTCESADLPLASFDFIVTTWVMCMVHNPGAFLSKIRVLLKPNGRFIFLEHGRSMNRMTSRLQDWWNPIHIHLFSGCNVNRSIDILIEEAGFEIRLLDRFNLFGLGLFLSTYRGVAVPP